MVTIASPAESNVVVAVSQHGGATLTLGFALDVVIGDGALEEGEGVGTTTPVAGDEGFGCELNVGDGLEVGGVSEGFEVGVLVGRGVGLAEGDDVGLAIGDGLGDGVGFGALHSAKLDVRRKQVQPLGSGPGTSAMISAFVSDANDVRERVQRAEDRAYRKCDEPRVVHGRPHPGVKFGCASR